MSWRMTMSSDDDDLNDGASTDGVLEGGGGATEEKQRQRLSSPTEDPKISPPSLPFPPRESDGPPRPTPVLLDELIAEVLSRVPVKSLLQFRCVCKSWKSLISNPQFVKNHLHRSITDPNFTHHRLMFCTDNDDDEDNYISCSVPSLLNNPSTTPDVSFPSPEDTILIGSCDGLLCFLKTGHLSVVNLSTRFESKESPFLGDSWDALYSNSYGFGYDHVNDKYKAVALMGYRPPMKRKPLAKVYTLASNSWNWKQIESPPFSPQRGVNKGKFVSGTLNWLATRTGGRSLDELVVVSFDMVKEIYRVLLIPDLHKVLPDIDHDEFDEFVELGTLRDCLCLFHHLWQKDCCVLWLMKQYGVEESWKNLVTISFQDLGVVDQCLCIMPFLVTENGEFLIQSDCGFFLFIQRGKILRHPLIEQAPKRIIAELIYVESLVSP